MRLGASKDELDATDSGHNEYVADRKRYGRGRTHAKDTGGTEHATTGATCGGGVVAMVSSPECLNANEQLGMRRVRPNVEDREDLGHLFIELRRIISVNAKVQCTVRATADGW